MHALRASIHWEHPSVLLTECHHLMADPSYQVCGSPQGSCMACSPRTEPEKLLLMPLGSCQHLAVPAADAEAVLASCCMQFLAQLSDFCGAWQDTQLHSLLYPSVLSTMC